MCFDELIETIKSNKLLFKRKPKEPCGSLNQLAWKRFRQNSLAFACLVIILTLSLLAAFGYLFLPDSTPFANHQQLELSTLRPGSKALVLLDRKNQDSQIPSIFDRLISGKPTNHTTIPIKSYNFDGVWLHYETDTGQEGFSGIESKIWLPDLLFPIADAQENLDLKNGKVVYKLLDGEEVTTEISLLRQEAEKGNIKKKRFWLGTDRFGRDMLSQLVIGARVSLSVGFIAVFISLIIGLTLGSIAGYLRGWVDDLIIWLINVIWSIPTLLLVIAITFAIGKGFWQIFVAVGLTMWVEVARVARGQVMGLREKEFVEAAKALGLGSFRIISRHILPNIMGPIIVISAANFASAILIEAGLSFLGIGVQPPMPSWGTMIREHYGYLVLGKPFLAVLPGAFIMFMVLAFMIIGNGLREALDKTPK